MHDPAHTLRFGAPVNSARLAIILLHGRGGEPQDMADLAESLPAEGIAYSAPAAEGGSWYPQRFLAPIDSNEPQVSEAIRLVAQLVGEFRTGGLPTDRIALAGFSQGACLALEFAARHPATYGFVAGLSGALIGPLTAARPAFDLGGTPVLLGCAESDGHIPLPHVERSAAILAAAGARVTKQIFPGDAHRLFPQEIRWLTERVRAIVTGSPA